MLASCRPAMEGVRVRWRVDRNDGAWLRKPHLGTRFQAPGRPERVSVAASLSRGGEIGPAIFGRPRLRRLTAGNPLAPIRGGIHGTRS